MAPQNNDVGFISAPWHGLTHKLTFQYVTDSSGNLSNTGYLLSNTVGGPVVAQHFGFHDLVAEKDNGFTCRLVALGGYYANYFLDVSNSDYVRPYAASASDVLGASTSGVITAGCRWRFVDRGEFWEWQEAATGRLVTTTEEAVSGTASNAYGAKTTYVKVVTTPPAASGYKNFSIKIV